MKLAFKSLSFWVCLAFLVTGIYVQFNTAKWHRHQLLTWDISGYHLYLPAVFIYHDLKDYKFYDRLEATYNPSPGMHFYGLHKSEETGRYYNKYTFGVALFEMPAFLLAYAYADNWPDQTPDGYSWPFRMAVCFTSVVFTFLGLLLVRRFLRLYFQDIPVAIAVAVLGFGTNLFIYAVYEPGMSHPYLFFLYAWTLVLTARWYEKPTWGNSFLLGLVIGWATLVRPTDFFLVFIPLFWGWNSRESIKRQVQFLALHRRFMALALLGGAIPLSALLAYWRYTTGHYIWFSYSGEKFIWTEPEIWAGLFSYRKGWFVYSPLVVLGFIGAFVAWRDKRLRFYLPGFWMYFLLSLYVLFCWEQWWYGGSYGCRAFIQSTALLGFPIAALVTYAVEKGGARKFTMTTILILGLSLNLFQALQWIHGVFPWDNNNREYFWRTFLKTSATEEDKKLLE